jgi:hypothetical protein
MFIKVQPVLWLRPDSDFLRVLRVLRGLMVLGIGKRPMKQPDREMLKRYAAKYIWWKMPDEAVEMPERVVAQVMDLGDFDDVRALAEAVGDDYLRQVIANAEAGMFTKKSWVYWHYRLGLTNPGELIAMPERRVA